jgi:hypothetical protein
MTSNLSDSAKSWIAGEHDRPAGVQIRFIKQTIVLPWSQFLYADGTNEKIRIAFSTHDIEISGYALGSLLQGLAAQCVSVLQEPARAERFSTDPGSRITSILIRKME